MRVFKFGGASVKNAEAVRNVARIIQKHSEGELWVVISAMGKSTNKLQALLSGYKHVLDTKEKAFSEFKEYHMEIARELFPFSSHEIHVTLGKLLLGLKDGLALTYT